MLKSCGCDYGMCTCGTTKDDIIADLQKRVNSLERERSGKYSSLTKYMNKQTKETIADYRKAKKLALADKKKFKKLINEKMTKTKILRAAYIFLEMEGVDEFIECVK